MISPIILSSVSAGGGGFTPGYANVSHLGVYTAYTTLGAAKTAALSGDTIYVSAGTYNENNLLKNGVNWYFYPGAIIAFSSGGTANCGIFDDGPNGANMNVTCVISGYGRFSFTKESMATGSVLNLQSDSYVKFVADTVSSTSATTISYAPISGANPNECFVTANTIISTGGTAVVSAYGNNMFVTADTIQSTAASAIYMFASQDAAKRLVVRAGSVLGSASATVRTLSTANLYMDVTDNIQGAGSSAGVSAEGTGTVYVKAARITATGGTYGVLCNGNGNGTVTVDCPLITTDNGSSYAFGSYNATRCTLINTRCVNTGSAGVAAFFQAGTNELRGGCAFVSHGSATESISSGAATNVKLYGFACGNKAVSTNIGAAGTFQVAPAANAVFSDANVT